MQLTTHLDVSNMRAVLSYLEKRFLRMCVLTSQGFQARKHSLEVTVGHNKMWLLGSVPV
jgi:hypothetical protein